MATERRVSWVISANIRNWQKNLNKAQRRMQRFARSMKRTGRSLTRNLTRPILVAGGAAAKMASDFETSLAQAQAQANLTARQVSFIGDASKDTAKRTGESTDEIIEAYKFAISAGKNLAESQEIVTAAAEASAAGFGKQRDLVRAATTALEAYSGRLDSGREFMDLLVGSAQVMELEVSKLSGAMQRNVGVAGQLGIGLKELLSGIGAVSEIMGDAQRGGRLFQTMLTNLLSPTGEAKTAIESVFDSLTNMRKAIREDGLLSVLLTLRKELEKTSEEGLGLVFSQRSLEAALNFTNNEGERTIEIMENMGITAGSTESAFDAVSDTTRRKFKKALRNLKISAIELGEVMLPFINKMLDGLADLSNGFRKWSEDTKVRVVAIAGLLAATGPIMIAMGGLISMVGKLGSFFVSRLGMMVASSLFFATVWEKVSAEFVNLNDDVMELQLTFERMWVNVKKAALRFFNWFKGILNDVIGRLQGVIGVLPESVTENILPLQGIMAIGQFDTGGTEEQISNLERRAETLTTQIETLRSTGLSWGEAFSRVMNKVGSIGSQMFEKLIEKFVRMKNKFSESTDATKQAAQSWNAHMESLKKTSEFIKTGTLPLLGSMFKETENLGKGLDNLKQKTQEYSSATEAAFDTAGRVWKDFAAKAKEAGFDFVQFLSQQVTSAITEFATTIGTMMAGAQNEFRTGLESLLLIVIDFAKQLGQILVAIGTAIVFIPGLQGPAAALIAGGAALTALSAFGSATIRKNVQERRESARDVGDALIQSDGSVVEFHPDDDILAMRDFADLAPAAAGNVTINNQLDLDGDTVWRNQKRVTYKRSR